MTDNPTVSEQDQGKRISSRRIRNNMLLYLGLPAGLVLALALANILNQENVFSLNEDADNFSFDQIVLSSSPEIILRFANTIVDDPKQELPVRLDNFQKKIFLAGRLNELRLTAEQSDQAGVILLKAILGRERLRILNGLSNDATREQLRLMAEALLESNDEPTRRTVHLALAYLNAYDWMSSTSDQQNASYAKTLENSIQCIRQNSDNEKLAADSIFVLIKDFEELDKSGSLAKFLSQICVESFKASTDPGIQNFVKQIQKQSVANQFKTTLSVAAAQQMIDQVRQGNIAKAKKLIGELSAGEPNDRRLYLELVNAIMLVGHSGEIAVARDLSRQAANLFEEREAAQRYRSSFDYIRNFAENWKEIISIPGIENDSEQEPFHKLIVVCQPGSVAACQKAIKDIAEFTSPFVDEGKLKVVTCFLNDDQSSVEASQLLEFARQQGIDSIQLLGVLDAKSFLDSFPLPFSPSWLLLDGENRLLKINAPSEILEHQILELIIDR